MSNLHSDFGKIAETILAAGDSIEGSYGTSDPTVASSGFEIQHRGVPLSIEADEGDRYQVQFNYRFSNALDYDDETVYQNANSRGTPSEEELKNAFYALLRSDLASIAESQEDLIAEIRDELSPMRSKTVALTHEYEGNALWDGMRFFDYLYPNTDSYSVHSYRDTIHGVYEEGITGGKILSQELDAIPDETDGAVAAEVRDSSESPAFH